MPIYAYRCSACGHAQDVLQKMSDPLLVSCPQCGQNTYEKQVTAASFRLKGTGWYVTDFRDGGKPGAPPPSSGESSSHGTTTEGASAAASDSVSAPASSPAPAAPASAAPPAATAD
ncbi:zinc ribbon domain-containing protein [Alcaligenaceae bacterium CGII-47]|nr:zinc ribbon domain-containing protein [Alcaligenaceae bacterium CGII-47]